MSSSVTAENICVVFDTCTAKSVSVRCSQLTELRPQNRQTDRLADRHISIQAGRQTNRGLADRLAWQTDRQTGWQTDRLRQTRGWQREIHRPDRLAERQTGRFAYRQAGRQAGRQTGGWPTDRRTDRHAGSQINEKTESGRQANRQQNRQTSRQAGRQTGRRTGRQIERLADKQTDELADKQGSC